MSILYTLSDCEKHAIADVQETLFDIFKQAQPIRVYKTPEKEIVLEDPNYSYNFGRATEYINQVTREARFEEFFARIFYRSFTNKNKNIPSDTDVTSEADFDNGDLIIHVKEDAFNYIEDAVIVYVYGEKFNIKTTPKRLGILAPFVYEYTLGRAS